MTTTASTAPGMQIIPGYECVERIGAGGYGEVWKVRAPGGLLKALKLVYGNFDEDRAKRELKAVNAMKEVRHPFILSVERVEVVEGRLAIVTELADGSLKDRFDECRAAGLTGVPREELLAYMRDAAEALDFLCQHHALQHLDVKPENLLIVAGRVKVADFGMVKSVQDPSVSQLNSLTPVYAPPEAFDGQPGVFSDQYSLSIVYSEMLTGSLPFSGKTTAQLAAQHIYGRPILVRLPVADQPAIQRALSKDPKQRFPNCRALIDALLASGTTPVATPTFTTPTPKTPAVAAQPASVPNLNSPTNAPRNTVARQTMPIAESLAASTETVSKARTTPVPKRQQRAKLVDLPPVQLPAKCDWARPTLFIGIGGTGGKALGQLRRKMRERFGDRTAIQAVQMLYIDTNPKALYEASQRDELTALDSNQLLAMPLQPASEYREDSRSLLGWLNRRWLYNIPRSLQTEGIRPLGRLAYVDHASIVWDRVRAMLTSICDPNGITTSAAITGLPFTPAPPRVFVVASANGGTGSGVAIDVALGVRRLMAEMNLVDEQVTLVLTHSTDRRAGSRDIALANSYACLSELRHFCRFPFHDGLRSLGFDSDTTQSGIPVTYAMYLGEELADPQFAAAIDHLAEFLYRHSVTSAATFFDACQLQSRESDQALEPTVRSVDLRPVGTTSTTAISDAADELCRTFVDQWRGFTEWRENFAPLASAATELLRETQKRSNNSDGQIQTIAQQQADAWHLNHAGITDMVQGIVRRGMGRDMRVWLRDGIARSSEGNSNLPVTKVIEQPFADLAEAIEPYLQRLTESLAETCVAWLNDLVANHDARTRGARIAAEAIAEHLRNVRQRLLAPVPQIDTRLSTLTAELQTLSTDKLRKILSREPTPQDKFADNSPEVLVTSYVTLMSEGLICRAGASLVAGVLAEVRGQGEHLTDIRRDLAQLSEQFGGDTLGKAAAPQSQPWYELMPDFARHLKNQLSELIDELEQAVEREFFSNPGEMRRLVRLEPELRKQLPSALRSVARGIVNRLHKAQSGAQLAAARLGGGDDHPLKSAVASIDSPWLHCGTGVRRLVVMHDTQRGDEAVNEYERAMGGPCTVLFDATVQPAVCVEAAEIPLRQLLDEVSEGRTDISQVADRLHTRIDIEWSR